MSKIGKNIKKLRKVKGLSQQAFANLFNLTRGNISSYEELRAEPKIETVVAIANYFSIPVEDFLSKELSVNEIMHYDSNLVTELDKLKGANKFIQIPYVAYTYLDEYLKNYSNSEYLKLLPQLTIPNNSKLQLIAFEVNNPADFPVEFNYKTGDIIILEAVQKENIHRIVNKLGVIVNSEGIHTGVFKKRRL